MADLYYIDDDYYTPDGYFVYTANADATAIAEFNSSILGGFTQQGSSSHNIDFSQTVDAQNIKDGYATCNIFIDSTQSAKLTAVSSASLNIEFGSTIYGGLAIDGASLKLLNMGGTVDGDVSSTGQVNFTIEFTQTAQPHLTLGGSGTQSLVFGSTQTGKLALIGAMNATVSLNTTVAARVSSRAVVNIDFGITVDAVKTVSGSANLTTALSQTTTPTLLITGTFTGSNVFAITAIYKGARIGDYITVPSETRTYNLLPETRTKTVASESRTLVL